MIHPKSPDFSPETPPPETFKGEISVLSPPNTLNWKINLFEGNEERSRFESKIGDPEKIGRGLLNFANVVAATGPDSIVFLDKSARPLYWGLRPLWERLRSGASLPEARFVNIGRYDDEKFRKRRLRRGLQQLFGTSLDGKKVMIVDETASSGETIVNAVKAFRREFPQIGTIIPLVTLERPVLPEWYGKKEAIGVREPEKAETAETYGRFLTKRAEPLSPDVAELRKSLQRFSTRLASKLEIKKIRSSIRRGFLRLNLPGSAVTRLSRIEGVQTTL
jgi:hypothetical protein